MVHFRKWFNAETLKAINEEICRATRESEKKKDDDNSKSGPPSGPFDKPGRRPRTYRQIARKAYLSIVRNKKTGKKTIRKAIGQQLRYVRCNLCAVDRLLFDFAVEVLQGVSGCPVSTL